MRAEAPLIDTTSATSGTVITQEQIIEMPSMSRVTTLFATLSPGVVAQDQNQNVAHLWSYNAASQFTVNGGRNNNPLEQLSSWTACPTSAPTGKVGFMPPPDAIQEFRVQMNAYDASSGPPGRRHRADGDQERHGEPTMAASTSSIRTTYSMRTSFTPISRAAKNPPIHFNEYGGTFGGPGAASVGLQRQGKDLLLLSP